MVLVRSLRGVRGEGLRVTPRDLETLDAGDLPKRGEVRAISIRFLVERENALISHAGSLRAGS